MPNLETHPLPRGGTDPDHEIDLKIVHLVELTQSAVEEDHCNSKQGDNYAANR